MRTLKVEPHLFLLLEQKEFTIVLNFDHLAPSQQALLTQVQPQAWSQVSEHVQIEFQLAMVFRQEALALIHSLILLLPAQ